ncbi:MAG: hypothetical protein M1818_006816 [Claussenomyces sp. TS43310]|nr:MAG: hypothetical protein M1818_006816 [Claussenomyces sp. TS43310]
MAHHQQPPFGGGHTHMGGQAHLAYGSGSMQQSTRGSKRAHDEMEMGLSQLHDEGLHGMPHQQMGFSQPQQPQQPLLEHHHHLPDSRHPSKASIHGEGYDGEHLAQRGTPSAVGQPGMPSPAARPRGPKLKFTGEDDALLVDLKENKSLTWKQIAEFFPGRSSGTLQVRYCTKLKAKTTQWTDETVQKLRTALQDYEQERWRIVANKVGTGFTPAACREKAAELEDL